MEAWEVRATDGWLTWFRTVDHDSQALIVDAVDRFADAGPNLGRPLIDRLKGAGVHNMEGIATWVKVDAPKFGSCSSSIRGGRPFCSSAATTQATGRAGTDARSRRPSGCTSST